jgi:hypothetical protein
MTQQQECLQPPQTPRPLSHNCEIESFLKGREEEEEEEEAPDDRELA